MKLKEYKEGRPTILRKWPMVYVRPGEEKEVDAQTLVKIRRASPVFAAVYARREILVYRGHELPPNDYYERHLKESLYGVDKITFYTEEGGRFHRTKSIDTRYVFGESGRRLATLSF